MNCEGALTIANPVSPKGLQSMLSYPNTICATVSEILQGRLWAWLGFCTVQQPEVRSLFLAGLEVCDDSRIDETRLTQFASEVGRCALSMTSELMEVEDGGKLWRTVHRFSLAAASEASGILCRVMSHPAGHSSEEGV